MSSSIGGQGKSRQWRDCQTTRDCSVRCRTARRSPSPRMRAARPADSCSTASLTMKSWPRREPSSFRETKRWRNDMGLEYSAVQWNRQKRIYDFVLAGGVGAFLILFGVLSKVLFPFVTDEITLIRAFGAAAFVLLHVILCIGPLCRLNKKFLPLLYNRRHAGVTMCLLGLVHGVLVVITYHAGGDTNPILSIFKGSPLTGSIAGVPFQPFGFFALVILFLMAATSHDFWLANLSAPVWKSLHMLVYLAYALLVLHVTFGVLQGEGSPLYVVAAALGLAIVLGLHVTAALREVATDSPLEN